MRANTQVSRRLFNLLNQLHDALLSEFGPDMAYQIVGHGGTVAACNARDGCLQPRMRPDIKESKKVSELEDWELVCVLACPTIRVANLTGEQADAAYKTVWAKSNGYGENGFVPPQGYDWSGIRDSTDAAKAKMASAARAYLAFQGITVLEYVRLM